MDVSIIVPVFNEEKYIDKCIESVREYFRTSKLKFELIIVDDGSNDTTRQKLLKYKDVIIIFNKKNYGKGYSIRQGVKIATGKKIFFTDCDMSTPIDEFMKLSYEHDIVIGSRLMKKSQVVRNDKVRGALGIIYSFLVNFLLELNVYDMQCGFKIFKKNIAKRLFLNQKIRGYSFDTEIIMIARRMKMSIKEVPVKWTDKSGSKVNPFFDGLIMLFDLFKIKWYQMTRKY